MIYCELGVNETKIMSNTLYISIRTRIGQIDMSSRVSGVYVEDPQGFIASHEAMGNGQGVRGTDDYLAGILHLRHVVPMG